MPTSASANPSATAARVRTPGSGSHGRDRRPRDAAQRAHHQGHRQDDDRGERPVHQISLGRVGEMIERSQDVVKAPADRLHDQQVDVPRVAEVLEIEPCKHRSQQRQPQHATLIRQQRRSGVRRRRRSDLLKQFAKGGPGRLPGRGRRERRRIELCERRLVVRFDGAPGRARGDDRGRDQRATAAGSKAWQPHAGSKCWVLSGIITSAAPNDRRYRAKSKGAERRRRSPVVAPLDLENAVQARLASLPSRWTNQLETAALVEPLTRRLYSTAE